MRERFARYLPSQHSASFHTAKAVMLADESLLRLLLNLSIDFESDLQKAHAAYKAALPLKSNEPSLEDLVVAGWARVVWGRISIPFEVAQAARSVPAGTMTAFASLLAKRHGESYLVSGAARSGVDLVAAVAAIDQGERAPRDIGCQTPEWVAARLWDRSLTDSTQPSATLRLWIDRWAQLGHPNFIPNRAWNQAAADGFRETALHVLETEPSLADWDKVRTRFVRQMALAQSVSISDADIFVPAVSSTVVDRALWLDSRKLERPMFWALDACTDMFGLIGLLLADVQAEDHASAPHNLAGRLIALALDRPEILYLVLLRVRQSSLLLADLLLFPATSALACLLIAQWQSPSSAWDRELSARDDQTTKAIAFADAVSIMGHFLRLGSVYPEEAASLLDWFHKNSRPGFIDDLGNSESMLAALRGELANQSPETLRKMVAALTVSMPQSGLGTSTFAAALDIVDAGKLAGAIDPVPLVTAYVGSVAAGAYTLSANRISAGGAASLFELAMRASSELRRQFFFPVDIKARMAVALAAEENIYTVTDTMARSIRAHIRILGRAVVGSIETPPDDLVNALIAAVRAGALKHDEKGRVAAFSARYESDPFRGPLDRPIASDFGAALSALAEDHRERLLAAILETDEPMVLAQLLSFAPHATRGRIEQRITDLTPSEAGDIHSLTEAQARIEELLSAGLADAAAQFMKAEQGLKTLGAVPGRAMTRLRATLRLQLLRRDWTAIAKTEPPADLSPGEQPSAVETVNFYKAVATLINPDGDRHAAEQMFAQLHHRRPEVAAYATNLFAARISLLLGGDLFAQLHDAVLVRGRQVLAEAEQMMLHVRAINNSDSEIFTCNKALLLLALGQPEQANELLTSLHASRLGDGAAAYAAVALARMGRAPEAMAILNQAQQTLGGTEVLLAARAHIKSGSPFFAIANVSSEDDPVPRIKVALFDLLQMDHMRQAEILASPPEAFDTFVIDHVRAAAGSVTSLVPMMKGVDFTSCEDDLTALIRELLIARFHFLGWSVPDQSKGGHTGTKGNPGERDLLLQKDSTTLAVIEAVVCQASVSKQNLTRHFQKIFGYSTCRLWFHLTYAYGENASAVLDHLRQTAEHDAPAEFKYLRSEDISLTDSRPTGFIARYAGQFGEVKVVFLVLDMSQYPQKEAAKTAAKNNPSASIVSSDQSAPK